MESQSGNSSLSSLSSPLFTRSSQLGTLFSRFVACFVTFRAGEKDAHKFRTLWKTVVNDER